MTNPLNRDDLNLLVVLEVLLRLRSVSRAADELNLTASAVSHALNRLRETFGNELLVRDGRQMKPTERAEQLADSLPKLIDQITRLLEQPEPFEPKASNRIFQLAAPDFVGSFVPQILRELAEHAPGVRMELTGLTPSSVRELGEGKFDVLIAPSAVKSEGVRGELLGRWPWSVFARKGHPGFSNWSQETWAEYAHLQIRTTVLSGKGPVDQFASKHDLVRTIGATVPQFSMAAPTLAETNLLLTVPSIAMGRSADAYHLEQRDVPFAMPDVELTLFRSAQYGDDPAIIWFQALIKDVFSTF